MVCYQLASNAKAGRYHQNDTWRNGMREKTRDHKIPKRHVTFGVVPKVRLLTHGASIDTPYITAPSESRIKSER